MMVKPWTRRLAIGGTASLALGGAWLAARGPGGNPRTPPPRGVLRRGNGAEPGSLDPSLSEAETEENILADLLVGLTTENAAAQPIPGMATHWTISDDGLTWTFFLRRAQWSDGVPVTAEDFVFSWRRLLDPRIAAPYAYFLYLIKNAQAVNAGKQPAEALGVRAADNQTLVVTLEHPAPYLAEMLTHMTTYPLPRHVIAAKGKDWTRPGNFVGNGAFMLTEWTPHDHITLTKNPRFYDAANVTVEKVIFYPTDDYAAALQRFRAGDLDTQTRVPAEQIDWVRAHMPEILASVPILAVEYIVINHGRKPFDDIRVRTALNLAINREAITGKIRRTGDVPAYHVVPPGIANYPGGGEFFFHDSPYAQRIAQAQALMRQAGYGPDKRLKTSYMIRATTAGSYRAVAAALQQMFAQVYIDITILPNDFAVFITTTDQHEFDIAQPAWSADFNDAQTFLDLFRTGNGNNWGQYSNPAYDALLDASQKDTDLAGRGRHLAAAEGILLKDQAVMPLFFWVNPGIARPYVADWIANPMDYHRSRWVRIDEAARAKLFT